jgi:uncharacterized membrane protein
MNMAKTSLFFGIILIALGLFGYFGLESESITAMIPAFLGFPILILGLIALNEKYLKHMMHAAAALMLLGFLGSAGRAIPALLSGNVENPNAVYIQLIMGIICLIFVILAVKSFIDTRKAREKNLK